MLKQLRQSSIGKKQIVAETGLMLLLYLVLHLSGNLLIFCGPSALNGFSAGLHAMGPLLYVAHFSLLAIFLTHIIMTVLVVKENKKARGTQYAVNAPRVKRSLSTKLMPYTGAILFFFLLFHLLDYTFTEHHGEASIVNGVNLGLYGLVFNSFLNPFRAIGYVLAMCSIGFHLTHGIQSVFQTFGFNHPVYSPVIKKVGVIIGVVFAVAFSSIPIYVYFSAYCSTCLAS